MNSAALIARERGKFSHPKTTASGEPRASVSLTRLQTLWFCTGTLCNLSCENCYIESTPSNDRLAYLSTAEVVAYLDEIRQLGLGTQEIGLTGGEPFMNPDIIGIMQACLERGMQLLVLTNAMRPMMQHQQKLLELKAAYGDKLRLRVSVDHFEKEQHQKERGKGSWLPMLRGLQWLAEAGFNLDVAGRTSSGDSEQVMRQGYARLFANLGLKLDAFDSRRLLLFPEMDSQRDVPEITTRCWDILGVHPNDIMCASSRMVIKHRGADRPVVAACTLLPYEQEFNLGHNLGESLGDIYLNHPFCAQFCVLGGASCSG